jgi:hypothetical protein
VVKRGGLNWHNTRMTQTERAERRFLAIAVTTLWLVAVGAAVEHQAALETLDRLPADEGRRRGRSRRIRLFVWGAAAVTAALINATPLPQGKLFQESWPEPWHTSAMSEKEFLNSS